MSLASAIVVAAGLLATVGVAAPAGAATTTLTVKTTSLHAATADVSYSATLAASGGLAPYTWSITSGSLPAGLTLVPATGLISGIPSAGGTSSFTVQVSDSENPAATAAANLSITVTVPPVTITTASLPAATAGVSYSAKLAATGGITPRTWSITQGALPAGLTLIPATGLISGIPSAGGTASFTVQVTDSENPAATASAPLSITVTMPPLTITTTSLPAATADLSYSAKLAASGGIAPRTWSITQGSLPAGLKLDSTTGAISGKPTAPGTANFTVNVSDGENPSASASANLSITVSVAGLVITTASVLPTARVGTAYSMRLATSGGLTPFTWSITQGSLPAGLVFHAATGVISGTPTGTATSTFTAEVSDSENPAATASATFSLDVEATPPQVTTTTLPGATTGQAYSASLAASGGVAPYTWSVPPGSLPAGLTLDPATGDISGTPTGAGTSTFTVTVTDSADPAATATASLSITAANPPLEITTTSLPDPHTNVLTYYSASLAASGGVAPYTWSITSGSLPLGLSLDPATGVISGTPNGCSACNNTSTFTVQVSDSENPAVTATASFTISLTIFPLEIATTSLPEGTSGQAYSAELSASGGVAPYIFVIEQGSLPAGLSLDSATGDISGTPTGTGTSTFTVGVGDSSDGDGDAFASLSITVAPPLAITTTSLPPQDVFIQGSAYSATLAASGGVGAYTWSITNGSLPPGLTLDPATGLISGTLAIGDAGEYDFTVTVTDSASPADTASANLSITVIPVLRTGVQRAQRQELQDAVPCQGRQPSEPVRGGLTSLIRAHTGSPGPAGKRSAS